MQPTSTQLWGSGLGFLTGLFGPMTVLGSGKTQLVSGALLGICGVSTAVLCLRELYQNAAAPPMQDWRDLPDYTDDPDEPGRFID